MPEIAEALRYLADHERPSGGQQRFNAEHLYQLVDDADSLRKDAERYRWLRKQNWNTVPLAVVCDPVHAIKLGHDAPSGTRLDDAIDAEILKNSCRN